LVVLKPWGEGRRIEGNGRGFLCLSALDQIIEDTFGEKGGISSIRALGTYSRERRCWTSCSISA